MTAGKGLPEVDAGDHYNDSHFDIVRWDFIHRAWEPYGYIYDWTQAVAALTRKRHMAPTHVWRVVKVETVVTHTDLTPLAERELGV